jgi:hypothetical protein
MGVEGAVFRRDLMSPAVGINIFTSVGHRLEASFHADTVPSPVP